MEKENFTFPKLDYKLIAILFLLATFSVIAIDSAEGSLPPKLANINFSGQQIQWYIIGSIAIAFTMIIDFDRFKFISWYLYGFGMLLLFGLEVLPEPPVQTINGATAWYRIPGLGNFQPSELMKIIIIIVLGKIIQDHHEQNPDGSPKDDLILLGKIFLTSLPPLLLIAGQPDLGNTMVMTAIIGSMVLVSGIRLRYILTLVGSGIFMASVMVYTFFYHNEFFTTYVLKPYQLDRFYGWLQPFQYEDEGFQLRQALLAIGSGQLSGKGYTNGEVYFPEPHTDFIFAVISEELGFIGSTILISLFFLFIYQMIQIGLNTDNTFGSYLCAGVIGMFTFQVFQNIGMTIGLLPITGITLPFISYGGSALLTYMIAIGFVLNVSSRTKNYMF